MKIARKISREIRKSLEGKRAARGRYGEHRRCEIDESMKDSFVLLDLADKAMYRAKIQGKDAAAPVDYQTRALTSISSGREPF